MSTAFPVQTASFYSDIGHLEHNGLCWIHVLPIPQSLRSIILAYLPVVADFNGDTVNGLNELAKKLDFLVFEDRNFVRGWYYSSDIVLRWSTANCRVGLHCERKHSERGRDR